MLGVIAFGKVSCSVIPRIHYLKVLWPIVGGVVVDMVDNLITPKRATNLKPCHDAVQPLLVAVNTNEDVPLVIDGARAFFSPCTLKPSITGEPEVVGVAITPAVTTGIGAIRNTTGIHTASSISKMCSMYHGQNH